MFHPPYHIRCDCWLWLCHSSSDSTHIGNWGGKHLENWSYMYRMAVEDRTGHGHQHLNLQVYGGCSLFLVYISIVKEGGRGRSPANKYRLRWNETFHGAAGTSLRNTFLRWTESRIEKSNTDPNIIDDENYLHFMPGDGESFCSSGKSHPSQTTLFLRNSLKKMNLFKHLFQKFIWMIQIQKFTLH